MFVETIILSLFLISPMPIQAEPEKDQAPEWEHLGEETVDIGSEKAEMRVPIKTRAVKWIKFQVGEASVKFGKLTVYFTDGDKKYYNVDESIDAGGETRMIALPRVKNKIKRVVFHYELTDEKSETTVVKLLGR